MSDIEKLGYVPQFDEMLHEVDKEEKKKLLWCHSDKLGVAFGLLSGVTPVGKPLRIIKNLRICRDCHESFKYIATLTKRIIIVITDFTNSQMEVAVVVIPGDRYTTISLCMLKP